MPDKKKKASVTGKKGKTYEMDSTDGTSDKSRLSEKTRNNALQNKGTYNKTNATNRPYGGGEIKVKGKMVGVRLHDGTVYKTNSGPRASDKLDGFKQKLKIDRKKYGDAKHRMARHEKGAENSTPVSDHTPNNKKR